MSELFNLHGSITNFVQGYFLVLASLTMIYFIACGLVTLLQTMLQRATIGQPIDPRPGKKYQTRNEIRWSLITCTIAAAYLYAAILLAPHIYPDSLGSTLIQIVSFLFVYDFYMYVTHRMLHSPGLSRFHARHHKAVSATAWSSLNLHPVEASINYLPFLLAILITPMSLVVLLGIYAYLTLGIANSHGNYNPLRRVPKSKQLLELIQFHQFHHSSPGANYGFLYTHWDTLFGTRHLVTPSAIQAIKDNGSHTS